MKLTEKMKKNLAILGGVLIGIGLIAAIAALAFIIYMLFRPYKEATKLSTWIMKR